MNYLQKMKISVNKSSKLNVLICANWLRDNFVLFLSKILVFFQMSNVLGNFELEFAVYGKAVDEKNMFRLLPCYKF